MMRYGAVYYPEFRTKAEITNDVNRMKELNFSAVRIGEFAWSKFEHHEGQYDFLWLDPILEQLAEAGIETLICTPSSNPPIWMVEKHPEILYVDNRGITRPFGARRHYCCNSPIYKDYCMKMAAMMAQHYGTKPFILGFHIDNELAQEGTGRCHCNTCHVEFHKWLEAKYKSIDILNDNWGTIFWGQTYECFSQINLPIKMIENNASIHIEQYYDNPSLRLDYERFSSDSYISFAGIQKDAIKQYSNKPITTNSTGLGTNSINYYKLYENLDIHAADVYSNLRSDDMYGASMAYAFIRGTKPGLNFWVVETTSGGGHGIWGGEGILQPYPGAVLQEAIHAFVSGAELVTHFQFNSFRFGAEQLESAVLNTDNSPNRRFWEFQAAACEIKKLETLLNTSAIKNEVALCIDYDTLWALKIKPVNKNFDYVSYCNEIYMNLSLLGIGTDLIPFEHIPEQYKLIIIPSSVIMNDAFKDILKVYVKNGGNVIATFLSAVKNEHNVAGSDRLPCGLSDLFGGWVTEVEPVFERSSADIVIDIHGKKVTSKNRYWTECIQLDTAKALGFYGDSFRKGEVVVSRNKYGDGQAYYVGTGLSDKAIRHLFECITEEAHIKKVPFELMSGVEVIERVADGISMYFIFNFRQSDVAIKTNGKFKDAISLKTMDEIIDIGPKGYVSVILQK